MKAIIITDTYDNLKIKNELLKGLEGLGLSKGDILFFGSLDAMQESYSTLNQNDIHLFFPSIYIRYNNLRSAIEAHKSYPFSCIANGDFSLFSNTHIISFIPSKCVVYKDHLHPINRDMFVYPESQISYIKPEQTPRICIYTRDRESYFRHTISGVVDSLTYCPEVPVTLVLNDPTKDVLFTALKFQDKYDNVEVFWVKQNSGFAGANIVMQWYGLDRIISGEDDFLLSDAVKNLYPLWPYQFYDKLSFVDYVGWQYSQENIFYGWYTGWANPQPKTRLGWYYSKYLPDGFIPLGGQLIAYTKEFMKKAYNKEFKSLQDSKALENSKEIATPFLKGYHIGFHKKRDGLHNETDHTSIYNQRYDMVQVTNMKTQEQRNINLNNLFSG